MKALLACALAALIVISPAAAGAADKKPAAAKPPATKPHVLQGPWKVYWLDQNKVTAMEITQAVPGKGTTTVTGVLAAISGAICPFTGTVSDAMTGDIVDGLEKRTLTTNAFVVIKAQCPDVQLWIEALGLPSGPYLMNGRATQIDAKNARAFAAVALGR